MSIHWMAWVWDSGPEDALDRLVMLKLADNAGEDGKCFPSLPEICNKTRLSESTVRRCVQHLERDGFLHVHRGAGRKHRSQYQLQNVSDRKVSDRKVSTGQKKGVTQTDKGVTQTNPPDPLIGVTIKNRHEPSRKPSQAACDFVLPDSISPALWADFEEMRRKRNKPLTNKARELLVAELFKFVEAGQDSSMVIERSIMNGWLAFYEVSSSSGSNGASNGNGPGSNKSSGAQERVSSTITAIREATLRRLGASAGGTARADSGEVSAPGRPRIVDAVLPSTPQAQMPEPRRT